MLLEHIKPRTVPGVDVGDDESLGIERQFAPTGNGNGRFPGQGCLPVECPVGANVVPLLLKVVYFHVAVEKPGLDETDHLPIPLDPAKFRHRVFEVHVFGIDFVGLVGGKAIVVGFERGEDVHQQSGGG